MQSIKRITMLLKPAKGGPFHPLVLRLQETSYGVSVSIKALGLKNKDFSLYLYLKNSNITDVGKLGGGCLFTTINDLELKDIFAGALFDGEELIYKSDRIDRFNACDRVKTYLAQQERKRVSIEIPLDDTKPQEEIPHVERSWEDASQQAVNQPEQAQADMPEEAMPQSDRSWEDASKQEAVPYSQQQYTQQQQTQYEQPSWEDAPQQSMPHVEQMQETQQYVPHIEQPQSFAGGFQDNTVNLRTREEPPTEIDEMLMSTEGCPQPSEMIAINPFPNAFNESSWEKLSYPGPQGTWHYIVGNIKNEDSQQRAIGVPGNFAASPPPWLKGFDTHMVSSDGQGYWIMFYNPPPHEQEAPQSQRDE